MVHDCSKHPTQWSTMKLTRPIACALMAVSVWLCFGAKASTKSEAVMLTTKVMSRQSMLHGGLVIDPSSPIQQIARRVC
jgi:hypothetical protein